MKKTQLFLLCLALIAGLFPSKGFSQQLNRVQGGLLVQFRPGTGPDRWKEQYTVFRRQSTRIAVDRCVARDMNIWSIRFDWTQINEYDFLEEVRRDSRVVSAQFNHLVYLRSTLPNDPQFNQQWHLLNTGQGGGVIGADLQMDLAWDITTGGTTPAGDTIVLCIIDNGLDTAHEDFGNNVWVNRKEIPNNGKDDDNNGYIDDYRGWNATRQNDQISDANYHGTVVAGIAGAKGNNGIGVTGVNWNVKLMIVVGGFGASSEDKILEAYQYPYRQRKRYNETNGKEGAYVVATNASWGLDQVKPQEYPIWCAFYDSLGNQGIINVAATSNRNIDVDVQGDMPTACESDFLIAVNSLDQSLNKAPGGYGVKSIDLAGFGENIWSTANFNNYKLDKGTSFAAPQVTGAVGLLYAANCPTFSVLAKTDPAAAARRIKQLLLAGVEQVPALKSITVTGGHLNVYNSLALLLYECGTCPSIAKINPTAITETSAQLNWVSNDSIRRIDLRWRRLGLTGWNTVERVSSPFTLLGLSSCTDYEYQFKVYCASDTLEYANTYTLRTDGCCIPPPSVRFTFISEKDALLGWNSVTASSSYTIRYRPKGATTWQETTSYSTSGGLRNLTACTEYEVQIRTDCQGGAFSAFSPVQVFRTRGCGACLEANYCLPTGVDTLNAGQEWIARVRFHDFENKSRKNGFGDFTGLMTTTMNAGSQYSIQLEPGFPGSASNEFFTMWIDFNQDGVLSSSEIVYESTVATKTAVSAIIAIPATAKTGPTRLRVVMRFNQPGAACSFPVDFFGEIEDYCVTIGKVVSTQEPAFPGEVSFSPNPFSAQFQIDLDVAERLEWLDLQVYNLQGQIVFRQNLGSVAPGRHRWEIPGGHWTNGAYLVRITSPKGVLSRKIVKQ